MNRLTRIILFFAKPFLTVIACAAGVGFFLGYLEAEEDKGVDLKHEFGIKETSKEGEEETVVLGFRTQIED